MNFNPEISVKTHLQLVLDFAIFLRPLTDDTIFRQYAPKYSQYDQIEQIVLNAQYQALALPNVPFTIEKTHLEQILQCLRFNYLWFVLALCMCVFHSRRNVLWNNIVMMFHIVLYRCLYIR